MALSTPADAGPRSLAVSLRPAKRRQVLLQFGRRKKAPMRVRFGEFDNGISEGLVRGAHGLYPDAEIEKIGNFADIIRCRKRRSILQPGCKLFNFSIGVKSCA
jgi:hypothetical protein